MKERSRNPRIAPFLLGLIAICAPAWAGEFTDAQVQQASEHVKEKLGVWTGHLSLQDWKISVVLTRRHDLKAKTLGGIRWDKKKKIAEIHVMDPADYQMTFAEMLEDMEMTIVHELVHLELASLPRSEASRTNEEYAVNRLAEALLKLHRQK